MQSTNYLTLYSANLATLQTSTLSLSTLTGSTIRASFLTLSTLTASTMTITSNVGIGTTNPAGRLTSYTTSADHNAAPDGNPTNHQLIITNSKSGTTPYAMAIGMDQTSGAGYINAAGNTAYQPVCLQTRGGNVGVGIVAPTATLHIKTTTAAMRITGNLTNTSTRPALSTTPAVFEIRGSGSSDGNDDGFLRISAGGGTSTTSQSYIDLSGYSTVADMSSNIIFGAGGAERMRITSTGIVGIGTNVPGASYALHVVGAIYATGNITAFSDQRYKQNIVRLDHSLDAIRSLSGYYYTREDYLPGERHIGLLAQEVKEVLPEAVSYDSTNDKYSVNYNCLIAPVVEAIKELYDRSEAQAKTIEAQAKIIEAQQLIIQKVTERLDLH